MVKKISLVSILILAILSYTLSFSAQEDLTLTIVTHDSFSLSEDIITQFETTHNVRLEILRSGDAGQMVNQSILSKSNPLGDVMFGVDNTFLDRALDAEIFIPYESPALSTVPDEFIVSDGNFVTPIDYGDVCLNYDKRYFEDAELDIPKTLMDLTESDYAGLLVTMNPATSSPGLAFLMLTVAEFGTEEDYTYLDYWQELVANDVLITDGWSDAYFGYFSAGSEEGTYPLVVSYASSPPFTVDEATGIASSESIVSDGMCFRQIEFAGILAGTDSRDLAQAFIDFMLSDPVQEDLPFQMFVFPVQPDVQLPELFIDYAQIPETPVRLDPELIESSRDEWITNWLETVTR